jgi:hypothetical protein
MPGEHIGSNADELVAQEIPPQSVTGGAVNGTGVDMQGWEDVQFHINIGAITGAGTLAAVIQEDTASNFGSAANVANAALTNITNTTPNNVMILGIARPTKRYVRLVVTQATNTVIASAVSIRRRRTGILPPTALASQTVILKEN